MKLGQKMILIIIVYFLLGTVALHYLTKRVVKQSYYNLQENHTIFEGSRVQKSIYDVITKLGGTASDWAHWNDTYEFLYDKNTDFVESNITISSFHVNRLDYMIILDDKRNTILGYEFNKDKNNLKTISQEVVDEVKDYNNNDGLIFVSGKAVAISSRLILDSNERRKSNGLLVLGYEFDQDTVNFLKKRLNVNIEVNYDVPKNTRSSINIKINEENSTAIFQVAYLNVDRAMEVKVTIPNTILRLGEITINDFWWFFFVVFFIFTILLYLGFKYVIIHRLYILRRETHEISKSRNLSKRLEIKGNDEVALLKDDINFMLDKIENMNSEITEYATYDILTGVLNRRAGLGLLEKNISLAKQMGVPLTIAYIDIDNLKTINDQYGHKIGDRLISDVASILCYGIRKTDGICRLGGDEFLVIFPGAKYTRVEEIFKRIQFSIDRTNDYGNNPYKISISKGIVQWKEDMEMDYFIDLADKRMYEDKKKTKIF